MKSKTHDTGISLSLMVLKERIYILVLYQRGVVMNIVSYIVEVPKQREQMSLETKMHLIRLVASMLKPRDLKGSKGILDGFIRYKKEL